MNALRHLALKTTRQPTRAFATGTRAKCTHDGLAKLPAGTAPGKFAWRPSSMLQKRTFASNIPPPPPPLPTPFPVYVAGAAFLSLGAFYASVRLGYVKDPFVGIEELEKVGNEGPVDKVTHAVYFDVAFEDADASKAPTDVNAPVSLEKPERIVIGLYGEECPRTAENFRKLATDGVGSKNRSFKDSPFHRVIPGFMVQGGDVTRGDGTGGLSLYGRNFEDESFEIPHSPFCVSMANRGPNTNSSQFFIMTSDKDHLDGKHVVFGHVLRGSEVVLEIERNGSPSGRPRRRVKIVSCGELGK